MKKNFYNLITIVLLCILLILIFIYSNEVIESVLFSFIIWKENIFTSLFPLFIITEFLISYGFIELLGELTKKITNKLFFLPGEASFVILGSMLSGFPSSAKYIKELLNNKNISEEDGEFLLCFTHFSNPLFVIGVIGSNLLNNKSLGFLILSSHILTNFIIAFIIRKKKKIIPSKINIKDALIKIQKKREQISFIDVLTTAITKTINTLILLLGIITTFLILSKIINTVIQTTPTINTLISGFLEMSQGVKYASLLEIPIQLKASLITSIISFGGISIHLQITSILKDTNIKYGPYFLCRIIHAGISGTFVYILSHLIEYN